MFVDFNQKLKSQSKATAQIQNEANRFSDLSDQCLTVKSSGKFFFSCFKFEEIEEIEEKPVFSY